MIEQLISRLHQAGIDLTYEEIADALWLAERLDIDPSPLTRAEPEGQGQAAATQVQFEMDEQSVSRSTAPSELPPSELPLFATDALATETEEEEPVVPEGLPFKAPAATALPNSIALSRALRPLSRKVPSATLVELDEEATVEQIAVQRIFSPVVKPELERWLDLELVVEDSAMSFVWRKTVEEFRKKVLERLGAFRNLRTWRLKADGDGQLKLWPYLPDRANAGVADFSRVKPRSPKALIHPSGRRLILLVSDCQSPLWQARPQRPQTLAQRRDYQPTLYDWLQRWASQGPATVVQLLPQRLWPQTELGYGDPVQLSALLPGVANTNLAIDGATAWQLEEDSLPESLPLPVVTLEAAPMRQWAKVVAGRGNERTPGVWFDVGALPQFPSESFGPRTQLSAEAKVNRFFASEASPVAKQLVRLMAAAPVSLSVVHLLQAKMLPKATPVHIAEVYAGGLLQRTGERNSQGEPIYDFKTEVRKRIVQVSNPDLTLQVFNKLTEKIKEEIGEVGESIETFDALLSPDPQWMENSGLVAPFAAVAMQVLKALGGAYAALAETVEQEQVLRQDLLKRSSTEVSFPPWQVLEFDFGEWADEEAESGADVFVLPPLERVEFPFATVSVPQSSLEVFNFDIAKVERAQGAAKRSSTDSWIVTKSQGQAQRFVEPLAAGLGLEMVAIPAGRFLMGSPEDEPERQDREGPQHEVMVPAFFMGRYAVTQAQWRFVAGLPQVKRSLETEPSRFKGDNRPVERVSWYDAVEFCVRLNRFVENRLSAHTNRQYRLPSEAEWEYACRAGTTTPFHFGETLTTEVANYRGNYTYAGGPNGEYREETTFVGALGVANDFGLCDMHGNVREWCADHYGSYEQTPTDGSAFVTDSDKANRIRRGGSWGYGPRNCRSAYRDGIFTPAYANDFIGFRVSCSAPRT